MKVLLINTYNAGGAAVACIRLHLGLLESDIHSKLLLKVKPYNVNIPASYRFEPQPLKFKQKLLDKSRRILSEFKLISAEKNIKEKTFIRSRDQRLELFSFPMSEFDITQSKLYQEADIINLHWVAHFLDWESFFAKNTKPIVWTLHDQNPFLGGEHYQESSLGMDNEGMPVPRKYMEEELKQSEKILKLKQQILYNVDNINIVAPSRWLVESSRKSKLFSRFPHHHIPYGFPTNVFKTYNRDFCREVLGIPPNKTVLLFVAESINSVRKGYAYLQKAIENLDAKYHKDILLCVVGANSNLSVQQSLNVLELGKIADERLMAMAYSSADVFIIPSLDDNLPNTMIESVLCGTPVIGFPVGGIPDVVRNTETGYVCDESNAQALQHTIEKFLETPRVFNREKIATEAKEKYALKVQADAYTRLYKDILSKG